MWVYKGKFRACNTVMYSLIMNRDMLLMALPEESQNTVIGVPGNICNLRLSTSIHKHTNSTHN